MCVHGGCDICALVYILLLHDETIHTSKVKSGIILYIDQSITGVGALGS